MSQSLTIEQLDPQGNWRAFSRQYPDAARAINAQVRATRAHNRRVAATKGHGEAGMLTRSNSASVLRTNIASGYTPEDLWPTLSRQWARRAA